jgi:hypothetical protein
LIFLASKRINALVDLHKIIDMLLEIDQEFMEFRLKNGTYKAFSKYYAMDVVTLGEGNPTKSGFKEVLASVRETPNPSVTWVPEAAEISDDIGYIWELFVGKTKNKDGSLSFFFGKYSSVW